MVNETEASIVCLKAKKNGNLVGPSSFKPKISNSNPCLGLGSNMTGGETETLTDSLGKGTTFPTKIMIKLDFMCQNQQNSNLWFYDPIQKLEPSKLIYWHFF